MRLPPPPSPPLLRRWQLWFSGGYKPKRENLPWIKMLTQPWFKYLQTSFIVPDICTVWNTSMVSPAHQGEQTGLVVRDYHRIGFKYSLD